VLRLLRRHALFRNVTVDFKIWQNGKKFQKHICYCIKAHTLCYCIKAHTVDAIEFEEFEGTMEELGIRLQRRKKMEGCEIDLGFLLTLKSNFSILFLLLKTKQK
jgi:hypothetical protein